MRLPFHGCTPTYIHTICMGNCCQSSVNPNGILVVIHPFEQARLLEQYPKVKIKNNHLVAYNKRCPFKSSINLCTLHNTNYKPFGCITSPFTLNKSGTLIVRNRYKLLRCYKQKPLLQAYIAFSQSLQLILGKKSARALTVHLKKNKGDYYTTIDRKIHTMLTDNDFAKRKL